jgi:hypothetical protein
MSDRAHFIEIDSIVLTGVDTRDPGQLRARVEAEVQQMLKESGLSAATKVANSERRVAVETASTVVNAVHGGPHRV